MAKIRRVVRRVPRSGHGDVFDEHLWPTYIALVVLGAFSMGITAAYLKFSQTPWYANAVTWLLIIPLVVAAFMFGFRFVDNRTFRRSLQFSIVVCVILHLAMVVQMLETTLFNQKDELAENSQIIEPRPPKILREYHPSQLLPAEDRPRNDFEKPVETETPQPQPEPDPVQRQQAEQEVTPPPQPVPVPETVATTEPNVIRRQQPNESAPRQAPQSSQLSRQSKPSELKISQQLIEAPRPTAESSAGAPTQAAASPVNRQEPSEASAARATPSEPTTVSENPAAQVAKRTPQDSPQPADTSTPTLKRQVAQPAATPRSQIAAADNTPQPKQTEPAELKPANTTSQKRATASPSTQVTARPVPEISTEPTTQPQRRQAPAESQPTVAQTPSPVANRTPRTTARPDVATQATVATPQATTGQTTTTQTDVAPTATAIERTVAEVTAPRTAALPSAEPNTAQSAQAASRIRRSETPANPAAQPSPATPTLTRRSAAPSLTASAEAAAAPAASTTAATAAELSPSSTATRRQAVAAAQAATATGAPRAAQVASSATSPTNTQTPLRRTSAANAADSPVVSQTPSPTATTSRSTATAVANVVTNVGDVPANTGPRTAASVTASPSASNVSRQLTASAAGATHTQPSLDAPAASPRAQVARGGATRAEVASVPSINPSAASSGSPARAVVAAATATSPTAAESPSANVASQGAGDPTAQPARMALNKSLAGVAGSGRSPNIDRSLPGGNSPSLVASSAARRAEATQEAAPGNAFSPSAPATIARSQAGEAAPTASLKAQAVEVATVGGGSEISPETATASAALTRSDAAAKHSEVTGAKGTTDIDLGPTQVVSEPGSGRAAGGGQAELNFETQASQLARRSDVGGAPLMSLAGAQIDTSVAAPEGTAGGQPAATAPGPAALSATRTAAGGEASLSGGPSESQERGPLTEPGAAALLAENVLSRADAAEGAAGSPGAAGEPGIEDEEERARRLARAARGGAPQLAMGGPTTADVPQSPMGDAGDGGAPQVNPQATAAAVSTGRRNVDGGAPTGGSPLAAGEPLSGQGTPGAETVGAATVVRAEATDGAPGEPSLGGGSGSPVRAATGMTLATNTAAETVEVAGAPASAGAPSGSPLEAQGIETGRLAGGPAGTMVAGPTGAAAGSEVVDAAAPGSPGDGVGQRQTSRSNEDGPSIGDVANIGAPGRRSATTAIVSGGTHISDIPEVGPTSAVAQAEADHIMGNMGTAPMTRPSEGEALAVNIEAPEGPGGIGADYSPEVGLNTRQARSESVDVHVRSTRFVRQIAGGLPAVTTAAIVSTDSFSKRANRSPGGGGRTGKGSPPPQTEEAIEMGLKFLARYQSEDGSWSLQAFPEETALVSDTGATALSLIAFQGAGYHHREHQYKDVVRAGLDFVVKNQQENGDLFVPLDNNSNRSVWLYSHSLATIALCEAYGMTQDPELREPAQKAIDFIVAGQHAERGGWRYSPGIGADTSVTGWMTMALKSGELANLQVPPETYQRIEKWLTLAQQSPSDPHLYRYNPYAPDTDEQRHGRTTSKTITSVGLLMRLYTGWKRDNVNMVRGADFLRENLPALGTPRQPERDTYYWYYATQVMFHMGGEHWNQWNSRLHPLLTGTQIKQGPMAGSWEPRGPIPDRWGPHAGRLYVTTMNLLSLEVYYRHLPLYEDTAK